MLNDLEMRRGVEEEFQCNPEFRDCHVGVIVQNGVVTLTGDVGHVGAYWRAEEAARQIRGVRAVANELEIKIVPKNRVNDTDLAQAAAVALASNVVTRPFALQVVVERGRLRLIGSVAHDYQRRTAESLARQLVGVNWIINEIRVVPPEAAARQTQAAIEQALDRCGVDRAAPVHVAVIDAKVTLSGRVKNWRQREDAELAARRAPGVKDVDNQLVL